MKWNAAAALLLLGGCSSSWFVYDTEPVETVRYRTPPPALQPSAPPPVDPAAVPPAPPAAPPSPAPRGTAPSSRAPSRATVTPPAPKEYDVDRATLGRMLSAQPDDPYALLAMGAAMERADRPFDASTYYRAAARYGESASLDRIGLIGGIDTANARTVREMAQARIAALTAR